MKLFRETTKWPKAPFALNHSYVLSDDKQWMYGYVKVTEPTILIEFSKRIRFDARYRTFIIEKAH